MPACLPTKPVCAVLMLALASGLCLANEHIFLNDAGRLVYGQDAKGTRIPDFSRVGYHSGGREDEGRERRLAGTMSPRPVGEIARRSWGGVGRERAHASR